MPIEGLSLHPGSKGVPQGSPHTRLKRACNDFEAIFVSYMLKSMRKTIFEDGLFGKSHESKIFKSMFDENLALGVSRSRGIGLGEMLFERLKVKEPGPAGLREGPPRGSSIAVGLSDEED
jgi:flagellar protein FlgJ